MVCGVVCVLLEAEKWRDWLPGMKLVMRREPRTAKGGSEQEQAEG